MDARCSLKKNSDFRRLYSKGKKVIDPHMVVYCRRNKTGENRLGYTVSKTLGHAVVRNRVRRRLREVYRLNSPTLKSGWDIIIVARTRCINADWEKLNIAFVDACSKLGLVKEVSQ